MPPPFEAGEEWPFLLGWMGGATESNERKGGPYLIAIAVVAVDGLAVASADPLNPTGLGEQVERARRPRQHAPDIRSGLLASRDDCPRQVARLKAMMDLLPLAVPDRKAILDPTHLPHAVSGGFDQQRRHRARCQVLWRAPAHAHRVEPVRLRQVPCGPIVFGQTA